MKLEDIDVLKLIPSFMREETDNQAIAQFLSEKLRPLASEIAKLATWDQLQKLDHSELDALAEELRIFWYAKDYSLDSKRALIASSDKTYMQLGTKESVERVVSDIFGDSHVEEWYDYGGQPHYFQINIASSEAMHPEKEARLKRILEMVKRKSQWLDKIINEILTNIPLFIGMSVGIHRQIPIRIENWQDHSSPAQYYVGASTVTRQTGPEQSEITL